MTSYSLQNLINDLSTAAREGKSIYVNLILGRSYTWNQIYEKLKLYGERKKAPWLPELQGTAEEDFYTLIFKPKKEGERPRTFYWKVLREKGHVIIISFSIEKFWDQKRCLDSLIHCVKGLWYAFLGAKFLENLDLFMRPIVGEKAEIHVAKLSSYERTGEMGVRVITYPEEWMSFDELRRSLADERKTTVISLRKIRVYVTVRGFVFKFSLSERAQIMFEPRGSFQLFSELLRPLVDRVLSINDRFHREMIVKEEKITVEEKTVTLKTIEQLQVLTIRPPEAPRWFESLSGIFSDNERLKSEGLVSFVLNSGNPFFLCHVVDLDNGSSVYLSATGEQIRIAPSGPSTKAESVGLIVSVLQKYVSPMIDVES